MSPTVTIGTHNGTFHCDEALACFLLKKLPEFKDAEILRTRDNDKLSECDVVVDVGGVYDHSKKRYDHHQREFENTMNSLNTRYPFVTKLSSAGLVYFHYGERIISQIVNIENDDVVRKLFFKMYENCIEEIDAIDNGVSIADGQLRYSMSSTISSRISYLNPLWNQPSSDEILNARFRDAMRLVGEYFESKLLYYVEGWLPARDIVKKAFDSRFEIYSSGSIISLTEGGCPWKLHLLEIEEEESCVNAVKYCLYSDSNGNWRVQAIPKDKNSFESRVPLYHEWRGIRDDALSELSKIKNCVFVHSSGFIGGNKTYKGALEMAVKTLELTNNLHN